MTAEKKRILQKGGILLANGLIDRPIKPGEIWRSYKVVLQNGRLFFFIDRYVIEPVVPGILTDFLQLAAGDPQRIFSFARRWGGLNLCVEHELPIYFEHTGLRVANRGKSKSCSQPMYTVSEGDEREGVTWCEPISAWVGFAKMAVALLNIASRLNQGKLGHEEDWRSLESWDPRPNALSQKLDIYKKDRMIYSDEDDPEVIIRRSELDVERNVLGMFLHFLIAMSNLGPSVVNRDGRWEIQLGNGQLIQSIVLQLMLAATSSDGVANCSGCSRFYSPERKPNGHRRNYCPSCRRAGVPNRDAARSWRERISKTRSKK